MTAWILAILSVSCLLAAVNIWRLQQAVIRVSHQIADTSREHSDCLHNIRHYVGDEFAAQVLNVAADDYDSGDEIHRIKVLSRGYKEGGPSVPAMWLHDRADRLTDGEA